MTGNDDLRRFDAGVWDKFFEFVSPSDEGLSRAQVHEELRRAGIDVSGAITKVQQALEFQEARRSLAGARTPRESAVERIRAISLGAISNVRQAVHDLIARNVPPASQAVYFSKLEGAASDQDLRSILEDIERLDALEREGPNAQS